MTEEAKILQGFRTDEELAAEYLIRQALLAKIPIEEFPTAQSKVRSRLDEKWHASSDFPIDDQLNNLYDIKSDWARTRSLILIEGGSLGVRAKVGHAILYRSIVNNAASANGSALVKSCEELVRDFGQFGDARAVLQDILCNIQCLLIAELDLNLYPKNAAYANVYFEELIQTRQISNRPTIITFAQENIDSAKGDRNYSLFSRTLDAAIKNPNNGSRRIYHFRCNYAE
jgi:hypothetical protein